MKTCKKCNLDKPLDEMVFGENSCKSCRTLRVKEYKKLNPQSTKKYRKKYEQKTNNFLTKKIKETRNKLRFALKPKKKYLDKQLMFGCTAKYLKQHIESLFEPWMTWENKSLYNGTLNYGWDVDHIIQLSTAKTIEDVVKLNHYTNLRPLCTYKNRVLENPSFNN